MVQISAITYQNEIAKFIVLEHYNLPNYKVAFSLVQRRGIYEACTQWATSWGDRLNTISWYMLEGPISTNAGRVRAAVLPPTQGRAESAWQCQVRNVACCYVSRFYLNSRLGVWFCYLWILLVFEMFGCRSCHYLHKGKNCLQTYRWSDRRLSK